MEKIVFNYKKAKEKHYTTQTIRVSGNVYREIENIARESGLQFREVADRLLLFALERVEFAEQKSGLVLPPTSVTSDKS